jgi:predicted NBD/HSP70 family sugar kinase
LDKLTVYRKNIVKELFFTGELSSGDIGNTTGKSLPIVSKILDKMMAEGWLVECGYATSTGGRRPQMFSLAPDLFYILAIAVDQHITQAAIIDVNRKIQGTETLALDLKDNADAFQLLTDFINGFIEKSGVGAENILGAGIGMPGFVDANKGVNYSYFRNVPGSLATAISIKIGLPVFIDNDSSVMALAELRMGAVHNRNNAMVINLGWGIGLGMIINGKLFRGDNGFAGEFSHIPLFLNNKICDCGKSGCLETETSLYVMAEKAVKGLDANKPTQLKDLSLDHLQETTSKILSAAMRGDKFAVELLSDIAYNVGRGVAVLIHIVNPGQIILTGRGASAGKLWLAPLQQALNVYCIPRLAENTTVEVSALGNQAGLLGAAALVMENIEDDFFVRKTEKTRNAVPAGSQIAKNKVTI